MSVCKHCGQIGGYHHFGCTASRQERGFQMIVPEPPKQEYRIEWFGSLQVHQPVRNAA